MVRVTPERLGAELGAAADAADVDGAAVWAVAAAEGDGAEVAPLEQPVMTRRHATSDAALRIPKPMRRFLLLDDRDRPMRHRGLSRW
jgi:hypothetical protein